MRQRQEVQALLLERDRSARVDTVAAASRHVDTFAETELDRLSNSVVDLINDGRLDEAEAACEQLRTRYPEVTRLADT